MPGGGLAIGPGYRGTFGDTGSFDVHAGWSLKNYKTANAALTLPAFADGTLHASACDANWTDAPEVAFYGTGNDSLKDQRTGFGYGVATVGVTTRFQATDAFSVGAGLDSIRTEASAPGAVTTTRDINPTYRRTRLFAEVDTRTSPGYTRSGGLYRRRVVRLHADQRRRLQLPAPRRRGAAVHPGAARELGHRAAGAWPRRRARRPDEDVPYFLMPELGGSHWLRGYPTWRFRDRNRLLLSGEYRWTAGPFVDMALFLDAGRVAARARDLDTGFRKSYGIGMTLHTLTSTVTRIELARTAEGTSVLFSFSPSF